MNQHGETIVVNFVVDSSPDVLRQARAAFLADAEHAGFGTPIVDGDSFYGRALRIRQAQKDFVGWTVPGEVVVAIQRNAKLPIDRDARALLDTLTPT